MLRMNWVGGVMSSVWRTAVVAAIAIVLGSAAGAQSLEGFVVGADAAAQMASRPKPGSQAPVFNDRAEAWELGPGLSLHMTWSPLSGKVVFVEKDWVKGAPTVDSGVPGLTFGVTHLSDIRARFGSNGFGFRSNVAQVNDDGLAFVNCFEIAGHDGLVLVVVTLVHNDQIPEFKQHPDSGKATLESVMLADRNYLRTLWGDEMRPDPKYHPIDW